MGLVLKQGAFVTSEKQNISETIENYRVVSVIALSLY
jgi:hypothetical protein